MTSVEYWSGLVGVFIGGMLSLAGTWLQTKQAEAVEIRADARNLRTTAWLRNRKLREKTYAGLTSLVLNLNSELADARKSANAGERPAYIDIASKKMERIWVEVHIYATNEVKLLWLEWRSEAEALSASIGRLVVARIADPVDPAEVTASIQEIDNGTEALNASAKAVIDQMHSEMDAVSP